MKNDSFDELKIKIEKGEKWWLGVVADGYKMPFDDQSNYKIDARVNETYNQINPVFLSNKGRSVKMGSGFSAKIKNGELSIEGRLGVEFGESRKKTLKGAFEATLGNGHKTAEIADKSLFKTQYCTWMEVLRDATQKKVIEYAQSIIDAGLPVGTILLDDGWQNHYGDFEFNHERFPSPDEMCAKLHELGFKVILWVCPFIDENSKKFEDYKQKGCLVRDRSGKVAMRKWWSGVSALLDFSNPKTVEEFKKVTDGFIALGFDGFKLDGGDAMYYNDNDKTFGNVTANDQSKLWAQVAQNVPIGELRASYGYANTKVFQRLSDKSANWSKDCGLGALVPNMITMGLVGYVYSCADMIGGGQEQDISNGNFPDDELIIRWCECAALMPIMQFSTAFWRRSPRLREITGKYANLHEEYLPYIGQCADEYVKTGYPIVRALALEYPDEEVQTVTDSFLLGSKYLVAPVVEKGATTKRVFLPHGTKWKNLLDGKEYGEGEHVFEVALEDLLVLEKI